jgi:tetratricopeptide (TPR) repeat protein
MKVIRLTFSLLFLLTGCSSTRDDTLEILSNRTLEIPATSADTPALPERKDAIKNYQDYLDNSHAGSFSGDAIRRLADLELETGEIMNIQDTGQIAVDGRKNLLSAIEHYEIFLKTYPENKDNDHILYQLSKAYALIGETDKALEALDQIAYDYPKSAYIEEVQFRRGESLFSDGNYAEAEIAYFFIVSRYKNSTYYEKSQYKLGWSQFKQSSYKTALDTFTQILDQKQSEGKVLASTIRNDIPKTEYDFITDVLRVISYALSYNNDVNSINALFVNHPQRIYEPLIYKSLAELYLSKERHIDAANVYLAYTTYKPASTLAPEFHDLAIQAYQTGKFNNEAIASKKSYIQKYGIQTPFWLAQTEADKQAINTRLRTHIRDLAAYYHALAKPTKSLDNYKQAIYWYGLYIQDFPDDKETQQMNFLLAESYFDTQDYFSALSEYEKTAYSYADSPISAEAGYASVIAYEKLLAQTSQENIAPLKIKQLQNAVRFCNTFPGHKHAIAVTTNTAEELYKTGNFTLAAEFANRVVENPANTDINNTRTAWIVLAHSQFELGDYLFAEKAYSESLKLVDPKDKLYPELSDRLAASIYKQGEQARNSNDYSLAAMLFMRAATTVPSSSISATAEYDAATMHLKLEEWDKSIGILENFRKTHGKNPKYSQGISEKLVLAYSESGQYSKAADEIGVLIGLNQLDPANREMVWKAAELYEKDGKKQKSIDMYMTYIKNYPEPFAQNIEAHKIVSDFYEKTGPQETWHTWLRKTVNAERNGGPARTERTHYIAASALVVLTRPVLKRFENVNLTIPLNKSLATKKTYMQEALEAYKEIMSYQIAEFTTESTYRVGGIYQHLAKSLMDSERPKELSEEEVEQYNILLEEQAFPFEEKAIEIHASNAQRTKDGIYDEWVKKSIDMLATLQPVRYQKPEKIQPYALVGK